MILSAFFSVYYIDGDVVPGAPALVLPVPGEYISRRVRVGAGLYTWTTGHGVRFLWSHLQNPGGGQWTKAAPRHGGRSVQVVYEVREKVTCIDL